MISAHNDFADIEGETEDLVKLREEMVAYAHDRGEGLSVKDLTVAVTMQVKLPASDCWASGYQTFWGSVIRSSDDLT